MRPILLRSIVGAGVLLAPMAAIAGISLSPIMHSWNHSKRTIDAMLVGQTLYDEAQIRHDLEQYARNAGTIAAGIHGNNAEARDFSARFKAFAGDSQSVINALSQPSLVRVAFHRVVTECQSCHAIYNN